MNFENLTESEKLYLKLDRKYSKVIWIRTALQLVIETNGCKSVDEALVAIEPILKLQKTKAKKN